MTKISDSNPAPTRWVPFAYGFRPFFLLAGWYALVGMTAWWVLLANGVNQLAGLPAALVHGHEMLFGFAGAAVAGFMLTAVPSWTGSPGHGGKPLILLTALWLIGRLAVAFSNTLPWGLVSFVELLFLPLLAALVAPPLLREGNRNTPLLVVILLLWSCDAAFLWAWREGDPILARLALGSALNIILLLITVIGGRIVPAFTGNALRKRGIEVSMPRRPWLEKSVIGSMAALILLDLAVAGGRIAGLIALIAGLLHLVRLAGWHGHRSLADPIVWILHAAYAWLPVGLLLKAAFLLGGFAWAGFWMHALGAGAAAGMIMAVMSRASLGHTGRPLKVAPVMAWAYGFLLLAAALRVLGPTLLPLAYNHVIALASASWLLAWLIYCAIYSPILLKPRADGKTG